MSENASLTRCRSVTRRLYVRMRKAAITTMIAKTMSHPSDIATPPTVILRCPYSTGNRPGTAEGDPPGAALHDEAITRVDQKPNGLQAPLGLLAALLSWLLRPTWANGSLEPVTSPTAPVAVEYS